MEVDLNDLNVSLNELLKISYFNLNKSPDTCSMYNDLVAHKNVNCFD